MVQLDSKVDGHLFGIIPKPRVFHLRGERSRAQQLLSLAKQHQYRELYILEI